MFKLSVLKLCAFLAATLFATSASGAVITSHTTRADFLSAAGTVTTEDFNGLAGLPTSFIGTPLDFGDFTVVRSGASATGQFEPGTASFNVDGTTFGHVFTGPTPVSDPPVLTFVFAAPTTAFALDVNSLNDDQVRSNLLVDGQMVALGTAVDGLSFVGITSDMPFTTVSFSPLVADRWGFDNLSFATASVQLALPATLPLVIVGLAALGAAVRRRGI